MSKEKIKAAGWEVGDIDLFLSPEEVAMVDIRFALAKTLHEHRKKNRVSQAALARRAKTTQPRIVLAEKADASISLDYMVRSLLSAGASRRDIAMAVAGR